jgi:hypothetical protein
MFFSVLSCISDSIVSHIVGQLCGCTIMAPAARCWLLQLLVLLLLPA